ncbi:hypothetical protein QTP88_005322 [Uroleucon formosanum]
MLSKHDKPFQQVVTRYEEQCKNIKNDNPKNKDILNLTAKMSDCFALTKQREVIQIDSIVTSKENHSDTDNFVGKIFSNKYDFLEIPFKSSKIDIFMVQNFSQNLKQRTKSDLKNKLFLIHFENKQVVIDSKTSVKRRVNPDEINLKKYKAQASLTNIGTYQEAESKEAQVTTDLSSNDNDKESIVEADDSDQKKDYYNVPEKNIFTKLSWDNENNSINTAMDNELQTKRNITYENSLQSIKRKKPAHVATTTTSDCNTNEENVDDCQNSQPEMFISPSAKHFNARI